MSYSKRRKMGTDNRQWAEAILLIKDAMTPFDESVFWDQGVTPLELEPVICVSDELYQLDMNWSAKEEPGVGPPTKDEYNPNLFKRLDTSEEFELEDLTYEQDGVAIQAFPRATITSSAKSPCKKENTIVPIRVEPVGRKQEKLALRFPRHVIQKHMETCRTPITTAEVESLRHFLELTSHLFQYGESGKQVPPQNKCASSIISCIM
jgi:hypothetical protein